VLHVGDVPETDLTSWELRVFGAVAEERRLSWDDLRALPEARIVCDIHCVTKWTKLDTQWSGVRFQDVMALVEVDPAADTVIAHAEGDFVRWFAGRARSQA
jgi:DMSO/TMAO reductase YedYZ molybdopterin-dependent catalytic subunit